MPRNSGFAPSICATTTGAYTQEQASIIEEGLHSSMQYPPLSPIDVPIGQRRSVIRHPNSAVSSQLRDPLAPFPSPPRPTRQRRRGSRFRNLRFSGPYLLVLPLDLTAQRTYASVELPKIRRIRGTRLPRAATMAPARYQAAKRYHTCSACPEPT